MSARVKEITIQITVHDPEREGLLAVSEARAFADLHFIGQGQDAWVFFGADRTCHDEIILRYGRQSEICRALDQAYISYHTGRLPSQNDRSVPQRPRRPA